MMASELEREAQQAITLIKSFSLELAQYSPESQVLYWLNHYRATWIRDAIIEAVYQGRYKVISVQHILSIWQRRGQPVRHFTSGFEQVIADHLGTPLHLSTATQSVINPPKHSVNALDESFVTTPSTFTDNVAIINSHSNTASSWGQSYTGQDYAGLSIEAFPVKPEDTLVEVYQADTAQQPRHKMASSKKANPKQAVRQHETATRYSDYIQLGRSAPIQPFRPTLQLKRTSKV